VRLKFALWQILRLKNLLVLAENDEKISNIEAQQMECKYLISIQGILPDSKSDSSIIA